MLWAITSFFNPVGYQRRLENYRVFRRHLNLPLVAVELAYREFELQATDAEILVQLRGRDVMWQKERLLNVALQHLPPECTAVAWLDADVIWDDPNWPAKTCQMLERYPLVHLFEEARNTAPEFDPLQPASWNQTSSPAGRSVIASCLQLGMSEVFDEDQIYRQCPRQRGYRNGLAWACRADILRRLGLYDACIVGSGDFAIACAGLGQHECFIRYCAMSPAQATHYGAWASAFAEEVGLAAHFLPARIYHLWHGSLENRRAKDRHRITHDNAYDPITDVAVDAAGCWRWNSPKAELHRQVAEYFRGRKEDAV